MMPRAILFSRIPWCLRILAVKKALIYEKPMPSQYDRGSGTSRPDKYADKLRISAVIESQTPTS